MATRQGRRATGAVGGVTTGVATTALALLSAGGLATMGLIGAGEILEQAGRPPAVAEAGRGAGPSGVRVAPQISGDTGGTGRDTGAPASEPSPLPVGPLGQLLTPPVLPVAPSASPQPAGQGSGPAATPAGPAPGAPVTPDAAPSPVAGPVFTDLQPPPAPSIPTSVPTLPGRRLGQDDPNIPVPARPTPRPRPAPAVDDDEPTAALGDLPERTVRVKGVTIRWDGPFGGGVHHGDGDEPPGHVRPQPGEGPRHIRDGEPHPSGPVAPPRMATTPASRPSTTPASRPAGKPSSARSSAPSVPPAIGPSPGPAESARPVAPPAPTEPPTPPRIVPATTAPAVPLPVPLPPGQAKKAVPAEDVATVGVDRAPGAHGRGR